MSAYPIETIFRENDGKGVIRLKVAAICICIDSEIENDLEIEEELEPYLRSVQKVTPQGKNYESPVEPQAYLYIAPTGNLEIDVSRVLSALTESVVRGELIPVVLRVNLDGEIDVLDTWILLKDFYQWCDTRSLNPATMCDKYEENEFDIFDHAYENANDRRREFEAPYFDADYAKKLDVDLDDGKVSKQEYQRLLTENMFLRMGIIREEDTEYRDRPLSTRERNNLLVTIGILCTHLELDLKKHSKTAGIILGMADIAKISQSESTIENQIKLVSKALIPRTE